jgi:predicted nucleotidyltransferase
MEQYKLKLTRLQNEILRFLMINAGRGFNLKRIAENLEVSLTAVSKSLPELQLQKLIEVSKNLETKHLKIELKEDKKIIQLKRVENLKQIYEFGLVDFLEEKLMGATIILFGSYSRGEDTLNSDIDIAIIGRKEMSIDFDKYEKLFKREIRMQFYKSFKNIHKNLRENLCNGILLSGAIELL